MTRCALIIFITPLASAAVVVLGVVTLMVAARLMPGFDWALQVVFGLVAWATAS